MDYCLANSPLPGLVLAQWILRKHMQGFALCWLNVIFLAPIQLSSLESVVKSRLLLHKALILHCGSCKFYE